MQIRVIENRKKYYTLSCVVIGLGILFMVINMLSGKGAFSKDIKFAGGSLLQVNVKQAYSNEIKGEVEAIAKEVTGHNNITITSLGETGVSISLPQTELAKRTELFDKLQEKYGLEDTDLLKDVDVSPSISKEIKTGAVKAVMIGAILILIYITFRFKDYRFGASAVIALLHDVLVMLTVYAIFRIPLNTSFIAAMLTIVGYSINDSIVVFDRIRENKVKKGTKENQVAPVELVDDSVNQTIGRSISTSVTTLVMIAILFILGTAFGVESITEFTFPLIIGVLAGTYSSIFVASPLWYDLSSMHAKRLAANKPQKVSKKKR